MTAREAPIRSSPMGPAIGWARCRSARTPFQMRLRSAGLEVVSGATTIVLAVDYVPGPKGTLNIQRYDCADGDEGTTITVGGGPNNGSCVPSDKSVSVASAEGGAAPLVIDLGEDGTLRSMSPLAITCRPMARAAPPRPVQVTEGESVTAAINSTIRTGAIAASLFWCSESVSGSVNPSSWGNWTNRYAHLPEPGSSSPCSIRVEALISTASTGGNGSLCVQRPGAGKVLALIFQWLRAFRQRCGCPQRFHARCRGHGSDRSVRMCGTFLCP